MYFVDFHHYNNNFPDKHPLISLIALFCHVIADKKVMWAAKRKLGQIQHGGGAELSSLKCPEVNI